MAGESLLGAEFNQELSADTIAFLDQFLSDTVVGDGDIPDPVVTDLGDGGASVFGTGANGETQGVVVSGGVALAAVVSDGLMELAIQLPAGVDIGFEGLSNAATPEEIKASLDAQIAEALPVSNADAAELRASLEQAVNNLVDALNAQGVTDVIVRVVSFADNSNPSSVANAAGTLAIAASADALQTIVFDASGSTSNEVFALLLSSIDPNNALELKGVEGAMLIGSGTVVVGDSTDTNLQGDIFDQNITGGSGNDTLVGGGGNDTLIGGDGDDIIGFNALGNYVVEGFGATDKLAFQIEGINSIDDLIPLITNVTESNGDITYEFVDGAATITLVGVTADEVTVDMVQFTL